ncbi:MAG: hypothetical protein MJ153_08645, partial [Clostridia bacterium]|nr:hypothetical protein [Clostridia bacterium]
MKKRLLSIILSMSMCISSLPMLVSASVTEYNLWVNGERFTSRKLKIECGDGIAKFDPNSNELTLTNATISSPYITRGVASGICVDIGEELIVNVVGTNNIDLSDAVYESGTYACGIYSFNSDSAITLKGGGSVSIDVESDCSGQTYSIMTYSDLTFDGVSLNCAVADYGIFISGDLILTDIDEFKVASRKSNYLLKSSKLNCDFSDYRVYVSNSADGKDAELWDKEGSPNEYKYISMELINYGVWVNGEQFTRDITEIKCGDGTAKYNRNKKELTLNNAVITETCDIRYFSDGIHSKYPLNIIVEGTNSIEIDDGDDGIYADGNITLRGTGSLDITIGSIINEKSNCGIFNVYSGSILIDMDGKLTVKAVNNGIATSVGVFIEGSGDIEVESLYSIAIAVTKGSVVLNGENNEIKFTSSKGRQTVYNGITYDIDFVVGDNIDKYDVEGAPEESSLKYTLKTYNVTFDMGGHGVAIDNQIVKVDKTIDKPDD